jgi:hypothetical protein
MGTEPLSQPAAHAGSGAQGNSPPGSGAATIDEDEELEPSTIVGWANVSRDGGLAAARNVAGHTRHGIGNYEIVMKKRSLQSCNPIATLHSAGFISVNAGPLPNSLSVEIRNRFGVPTDAGFYLRVAC